MLGMLENAFAARQNLNYASVAGRDIVSALMCELNVSDTRISKLMHNVADEARARGLLHADAATMRPTARGWEQTKGILYRRLSDAIDEEVGLDILRQQR